MSSRTKGGKGPKSPRLTLEDRRRAFDSLPSDKKDSRRRPGSMSGRK